MVEELRQHRRIAPKITARARQMRREMTDAERHLWHHLNRQQLLGLRFRRQHPIAGYIADFACVELKLVIEVDGGQHQVQQTYDDSRSAALALQGWTVQRFWNHEVLGNLEGVLIKILEHVQLLPPPQPSPCKGEGAARSQNKKSE
ncbi:endonuclease domain-containing protein [Ferriphaselus sp. R-1]|uniref:endonuclease domain-containing protein n=1 Tax=Ferriphaselus sp. R-1 TaxID=1485544 RepID=UPI0009DF0E28|nr:endonuclease domain-containing protein [Ferriphaselus sp. R-1]